MRVRKDTAAGTLAGIWTILLMAFVIAVLYVGKQILIPLALAALITFFAGRSGRLKLSGRYL
jgi:predicted PurR-regulated permease PerM